jgi:PEGA domain
MESIHLARRWTAAAIVVFVFVGVAQETFAQRRGGGSPQATAPQTQPAAPSPSPADGRFTSTMKFVPPPADAPRSSFPFAPFAPGLRPGFFGTGAFWFWGGGLWAPGIPSSAYGAGVVLGPPLEGAPAGGVQLDIDPRGAQVYVDGAYVGVVEDFSGYFRHLDLAAGPHSIAIVASDYEPLILDLIITPGRTVTHRATLVRAYGR